MNQMKQMKQQSGFTLVELVTTMVIVGTLAAVAVPKFADTAKDARITKLEQLRSSVITAAAATHNAAQTKNGASDSSACTADAASTTIATNSLGDSGTVCTENGLVQLVHGYPAVGTVAAQNATGTGIINVAGLTSTFRPNDTKIVKAGFGVAVSGTTVTFSVIGGSGTSDQTGDTSTTSQTNSTCSFTYTQTAARATPPVVSDIIMSGC